VVLDSPFFKSCTTIVSGLFGIKNVSDFDHQVESLDLNKRLPSSQTVIVGPNQYQLYNKGCGRYPSPFSSDLTLSEVYSLLEYFPQIDGIECYQVTKVFPSHFLKNEDRFEIYYPISRNGDLVRSVTINVNHQTPITVHLSIDGHKVKIFEGLHNAQDITFKPLALVALPNVMSYVIISVPIVKSHEFLSEITMTFLYGYLNCVNRRHECQTFSVGEYMSK
jgi:hypothetical protein